MIQEIENYKDTLRAKGFRVEYHTPYCIGRKKNFPDKNCVGCESEQGCKRFAGIALILSNALNVPVTSKEEILVAVDNMEKALKRVDIVLDLKSTIEEVDKAVLNT